MLAAECRLFDVHSLVYGYVAFPRFCDCQHRHLPLFHANLLNLVELMILLLLVKVSASLQTISCASVCLE